MPDIEASQSRATPRRINFCARPTEPDIVGVLRRLKEPDLGEVSRNLSDDALVKLVIYAMQTVKTPAELEEFYRETGPLMKDGTEWQRSYYTQNYEGMWAYFTGGHQ